MLNVLMPSWHKSGPKSARQRYAIRMALRWRADSDLRLYASLEITTPASSIELA